MAAAKPFCHSNIFSVELDLLLMLSDLWKPSFSLQYSNKKATHRLLCYQPYWKGIAYFPVQMVLLTLEAEISLNMPTSIQRKKETGLTLAGTPGIPSPVKCSR